VIAAGDDISVVDGSKISEGKIGVAVVGDLLLIPKLVVRSIGQAWGNLCVVQSIAQQTLASHRKDRDALGT
jgi:hypothetical protein